MEGLLASDIEDTGRIDLEVKSAWNIADAFMDERERRMNDE